MGVAPLLLLEDVRREQSDGKELMGKCITKMEQLLASPVESRAQSQCSILLRRYQSGPQQCEEAAIKRSTGGMLQLPRRVGGMQNAERGTCFISIDD